MNEPPSILRNWGAAYCVALAIFAVEVMLLYAFTVRFS
jgi:hypothetical protein